MIFLIFGSLLAPFGSLLVPFGTSQGPRAKPYHKQFDFHRARANQRTRVLFLADIDKTSSFWSAPAFLFRLRNLTAFSF